ncbi:CBS domain-containing protein [Streptomyces sp. NPDC014006]|uniref:CBS domain-containing protein n=1 Tax=Streptomyces sp. NPDC014006 TaxID=3364870 RepID=UPI0037018F18
MSDVMTRAVVAVGRDAQFEDIVQLMEPWKVRAVSVLEGDGRVIEVVPEADLLPEEEFRDSDPEGSIEAARAPDPSHDREGKDRWTAPPSSSFSASPTWLRSSSSL